MGHKIKLPFKIPSMRQPKAQVPDQTQLELTHKQSNPQELLTYEIQSLCVKESKEVRINELHGLIQWLLKNILKHIVQ